MGVFRRFFRTTPADQSVSQERAKPAEGYQVFTREFDEIIGWRDLEEALRSPPDRPSLRFEAAVQDFSRRFQRERLEIHEWSLPLIRKLVSSYPPTDREKMVVTFLIDHSGSMRGIRMISALVAIESAVGILAQCGIKSEILGFTTRSWKGGQSRKKWRRDGSPANPGRLCDLRHIIYKSASESTRYGSLYWALHPDLAKENIDGEALEWAASRLQAEQWINRAICFVSDGAPVDDSTLTANMDRNFLIDHLLEVEARLKEQNVQIGYLLLAGDVNYREFPLSAVAHEPEAAGKGLLNIVTQMLFPGKYLGLTDP